MKPVRQLATLSLFLLLVSIFVATPAAAEHHEEMRAVLVTGASSGIGRAIAVKLASEGFHVYAGARKAGDLEELDAMDNMTAVRLDVTVQSEIDTAVDFVRDQGRGLWGVVNNAGVAVFQPMNEIAEEDIDFVFDVNVYGPYRINKAFTPLLIESQGRTTTIGSISGYIAGPSGGTYSMSKFAVEAYTDAFAAEMTPVGVHVSAIEPGGFKSRIREKVAMHALGVLEGDTSNLSDEEKAELDAMVARNEALQEPDAVADAALHVMSSDSPRRRYMVVPNENESRITIQRALGKVAQLNADHAYSFSREELIELLDQALAAEY